MIKLLSGFIAMLLVSNISPNLFAQNDIIQVTSKRNDDKSVDISYTKKLPGSYYVKLEFTSMTNCYQRDFEKVVKSNSGKLLKLRPINDKEHINFSYKLNYIKGHPNPKVDQDFVYVLPFKKGESITVIATTNLKETYFDAEKDTNWKSFAVDRAAAETIFSMRKGIVIEVISQYNTDTTNTYKYTSKMNRITVEHEDGTFARYIGFKRDSIFVKLGQTIYPQTKLGVLDIFNNTNYRLYFDISYLKAVDFNSIRERTIVSENQTAHITPYFYSSSEPVFLENNSDYIVEINEDILFKEFTRREKKKYKKNPLDFE
tara:strand:+ start:499 stop:1446 length:948 start_codon:yes stop_codon:yes gene_type:complete